MRLGEEPIEFLSNESPQNEFIARYCRLRSLSSEAKSRWLPVQRRIAQEDLLQNNNLPNFHEARSTKQVQCLLFDGCAATTWVSGTRTNCSREKGASIVLRVPICLRGKCKQNWKTMESGEHSNFVYLCYRLNGLLCTVCLLFTVFSDPVFN